ncbi:hypothetical protein IVB22_32410 [Bradyrhizobium sp. 190]|uniref:hypothetical protein n=1 Tax=Bradyrhizobium sp. 190 TaxID=2782658 RepID=UPI001FF83AD4|nr:hypothetical protein [Bradyrhizobium sp. 190]MCK1517126.1 hypothetical protein [Bradyrhizobium sp. 190]
MNCLAAESSRPCAREKAHVDPVSPGKIDDQETLCRAGYTMHDRNGNPRISLIRSNELASGELSVWRLKPPRTELVEILEVLDARKPNQQELLWIFGVKAKEVRGMLAASPLCAIDNTDCGPELDRHPAHAVLAGCEKLGFDALLKPDEDPTFMAVRRGLLELFNRHRIWQA